MFISWSSFFVCSSTLCSSEIRFAWSICTLSSHTVQNSKHIFPEKLASTLGRCTDYQKQVVRQTCGHYNFEGCLLPKLLGVILYLNLRPLKTSIFTNLAVPVLKTNCDSEISEKTLVNLVIYFPGSFILWLLGIVAFTVKFLPGL